jgi:uncharacterized protein (DUF934 family)
MAKQLLNGDQLADDPWTIIEAAEALDDDRIPEGPLICPAQAWLPRRETLAARPSPVAVWLNSDEEPDDIAAHLDELPLIAIKFPAFNDGRALSLAVLLRTRFGFTGELRAIGAVHEDLIHYMRRCGIDSYLLSEGANVDVAKRSYNAMSGYYQGSVIDPRPQFRRRFQGGSAAV